MFTAVANSRGLAQTVLVPFQKYSSVCFSPCMPSNTPASISSFLDISCTQLGFVSFELCPTTCSLISVYVPPVTLVVCDSNQLTLHQTSKSSYSSYPSPLSAPLISLSLSFSLSLSRCLCDSSLKAHGQFRHFRCHIVRLDMHVYLLRINTHLCCLQPLRDTTVQMLSPETGSFMIFCQEQHAT